MNETTELRVDDRPKMENGEDHPGHDPQYDSRVAIAERYEQRRLEQMREQHEQVGLPPPHVDDAPDVAPAEPPEQEPAQEPPAEPEETAPAPEPVHPQPTPVPQLIPMALPDGRVTHVTQEQYQQLAALGIATLARPAPQAPQQVAPQAPPAPRPAASFDDTRAASIAQRLSFGTMDEQKQAVMELADALRSPQVDTETIRRQAAAEALQHMRLERNLEIIGHEYPEIFQDPVLTQTAALQLNQLRGNPQFQYRSDLDQYREACNMVRQRFQPAPAPQPQPVVQSSQPALQAAPTVASRQATLERKRAAPSIPTAADRRMSADGDETPRAPTASEIIAGMRKARHQPAV